MDLNLLRSFVMLKDTLSFSVAAERLGVPRSTVSRAITALEEALGVRLFHRTTRSVSVSSAGEAFYDRIAPRLAALQAVIREMPERDEIPSGLLRVTTTVDLGSAVLAEAAARYVARYPQVQVEVQLSNTVTDLVRGGVDLALRVSRGGLRDSTLVAQRVGDVAIQVYAARSYLARRGTPKTPEELQSQDWVIYRGMLPLQLRNGASTRAIRVEPRISSDDMLFVREALKAGAGIGALPSFVADPEVASGALERVLPRWRMQRGTVYLVRPAGSHVAPKVAAFRDLLKEILRQRPLARLFLPPACGPML